jgi:hypothetical protein
MRDRTVQDVKDRLLPSPRKSLSRLSQETCQRAAKKAKLHPYPVSVVQRIWRNMYDIVYGSSV